MVSTTKESVEEQEIAGNRDGDSKDRSRKTTEMVIKREQKAEQLRWSKSSRVEALKVGQRSKMITKGDEQKWGKRGSPL